MITYFKFLNSNPDNSGPGKRRRRNQKTIPALPWVIKGLGFRGLGVYGLGV